MKREKEEEQERKKSLPQRAQRLHGELGVGRAANVLANEEMGSGKDKEKEKEKDFNAETQRALRERRV